MSRITAVLIVALAGVLGVAHADNVYRWIDAHGEVHYTDQWRPGAVLIRTNVPRPAGASPDSAAWAGIAAEDKAAAGALKERQAASAVRRDEARQRAKECKQARAQYQARISARRVFTTDASGQRHFLSDSQAQAARLKARETMDSLCAGQSGS
jgi:hypothetical protein